MPTEGLTPTDSTSIPLRPRRNIQLTNKLTNPDNVGQIDKHHRNLIAREKLHASHPISYVVEPEVNGRSSPIPPPSSPASSIIILDEDEDDTPNARNNGESVIYNITEVN